MLFLFFLFEKKKNLNHHVSDVEWRIKATWCMCEEKYTVFGKRKSILLTLGLHSKWRHIWHVGFGETLLLFRRCKSQLILQGWDSCDQALHKSCHWNIDWLVIATGRTEKLGRLKIEAVTAAGELFKFQLTHSLLPMYDCTVCHCV